MGQRKRKQLNSRLILLTLKTCAVYEFMSTRMYIQQCEDISELLYCFLRSCTLLKCSGRLDNIIGKCCSKL